MYEEKNTGCNLPAQVEIYATGGDAYKFLFIAKGGGSANKTYLFQETKAVLNPGTLVDFLTAKMKTLGHRGLPTVPPGVCGGGDFGRIQPQDGQAGVGRLSGWPAHCRQRNRPWISGCWSWNWQLLARARELGIGAQFGGKYFCHDIRVVRLPRHGASCPIGMGVSCSADRNIKAKITAEGLFLEQLETDPARFLPQPKEGGEDAVAIDLDQPMDDIRAILTRYPVATRLKLSGQIIVGRDIAHAKLKERLDSGQGLPQYLKDHIIYYAGPAKTPDGYASGSFGPTTAGRMDSYVPIFQAEGASMVMLAKGNRSKEVTDACKKFGGFYLGSIGGPAARLGKDCITSVEVLEYPELGMEAIYMITVKDFPAFILVDDKGNDFFDGLL
jgi:fumarate hydratase class I